MPDGLQNNLSGLSLEHQVLAVCQRFGFNGDARHMLDAAIGRAPHGTQTLLSVWVYPCKLFPQGLGIDSSSYNVSGTAYQKVPYKIMNAGGWKCPGLIILEGDGRGIVPMRIFAMEMVKAYPSCVGVFTLDSFSTWLAAVKLSGKPISTGKPIEVQQNLFEVTV